MIPLEFITTCTLSLVVCYLFYKGRRTIIEYVGDVIAYVEPFRLSKFAEIRREIQRIAKQVADSVYQATDTNSSYFRYDRIIWIAHSLGSVVAYDALNAQLLADALSKKTDTDALERTKALITYGSPLDKIAFIFRTQRDIDVRDALAAAKQPLLDDAVLVEIPWKNVFSPADIISGRIDFFSNGSAQKKNRVDNRPDPQAITPLVAHTEYERGELLKEVLLRELNRATATKQGNKGGTPALSKTSSQLALAEAKDQREPTAS